MLSKLKISRDIAGIRFQQFFEMSGRGLVVAGLRTFESESVASKSVSRLFGDKLLQHLAACFLRWRHGVEGHYSQLSWLRQARPSISRICSYKWPRTPPYESHSRYISPSMGLPGNFPPRKFPTTHAHLRESPQ